MHLLTDVARCREALAELLGEARAGVAFTGAGLSTEAGIPDFRSPGSLWMRNKPIPFEAFLASPAARAEAWRRKFAMDDSYRDAEPTVGHRAIAGLLAAGALAAVVTQNIDGLHQASGVPEDKLVELHGNGTYAACLDCRARHELGAIRAAFEATGAAPACEACGGLVKSATISFGQAMPEEAMRRAKAASEAADLFIALGSSLVVYPAAAFPVLAKRAGAKLVIVNREATELDGEADLVLRGEIGPILEPFAPSLQ
jgi:NAD-dependent deacetylase